MKKKIILTTFIFSSILLCGCSRINNKENINYYEETSNLNNYLTTYEDNLKENETHIVLNNNLNNTETIKQEKEYVIC